jgi:endonuclease VIII
MPEGDVVWRTAGQLHSALAGQVLTRTDFRVPRFAAADLSGRSVREVVSRGKHILARVGGRGGDGSGTGGGRAGDGMTVHTHLRMDGYWRIRPAATAAFSPRDHRIRVVLATNDWQAVGYLLSMVEVVPTAREHTVVGHLGPDLLGPDWDAAEAVRRIGAEPGRPIGEALLDQRNLAGIGNFYRAEVLFLRGISPWRLVADAGDLTAIADLAKRLLEANKDRPGQVTTGNPAPGQEAWVYGRAGRPCRRCGARIRTGRSAGPAPTVRIAYWCPSCQP